MSKIIAIRVGQIWKDNDTRMRGRQGTVVEIDEVKERALIDWGRKTWVSFKRLRRISQYRMVSDPMTPANLKPFRIDVELDGLVGEQRSFEGGFTLLVWAYDDEDAEKLMHKFVKDNGKLLTEPEDCSYQIHDIEQKRGVEIMSGIMTGNSP